MRWIERNREEAGWFSSEDKSRIDFETCYFVLERHVEFVSRIETFIFL